MQAVSLPPMFECVTHDVQYRAGIIGVAPIVFRAGLGVSDVDPAATSHGAGTQHDGAGVAWDGTMACKETDRKSKVAAGAREASMQRGRCAECVFFGFLILLRSSLQPSCCADGWWLHVCSEWRYMDTVPRYISTSNTTSPPPGMMDMTSKRLPTCYYRLKILDKE